MFMKRFLCTLVALATLLSGAVSTASAADKAKLKLGWSVYVGWQPVPYAKQSGILQKWGDSRNVDVEVTQFDYVPSIEAFLAGKIDAVTITNMDALAMLSQAGVDVTVVVAGDYSNGNDAVLTRGIPDVKGLKGQSATLCEFTVSHYLLARALEMNGLSEKDVSITNVSDADIAPMFIANDSQKVVVTWNPMVMKIAQSPGVVSVFDSSKIPGEIQDLIVVRTETLKAHPEFAEVIIGAWYETIGTLSQRGAEADAAIAEVGKFGGSDLAETKAQLKTTAMFWTSTSALEFMLSPETKTAMERVRSFCFDHKLLGENAQSKDDVGIQYADGTVVGDKNNIKFRYDASFSKKHAEGGIKR